MAVPLLSGAVLATLFPAAQQFFGSFTGALFTVKVSIGILLGVVFGRLLGEAPITRAPSREFPRK